MQYLFLIGRIIVGAYYLYNGVKHFTGYKGLVAYAQSNKAPLPNLTVPLTGLLLVAGGVSFATGLYPIVGVACIVGFFLPVTFIMHAFWKIEDKQMAGVQKIMFMKNMALMGSALMFLAIPEPWEMSLSF